MGFVTQHATCSVLPAAGVVAPSQNGSDGSVGKSRDLTSNQLTPSPGDQNLDVRPVHFGLGMHPALQFLHPVLDYHNTAFRSTTLKRRIGSKLP